MRAIRLTSAAALGLAALSLTAPAASAVGGRVSPLVGTATPSTIAAGGQVTLSLSGCDGDADAFSAVFDNVRIPPGGTATATVDWDAKRGAMYTVTYTCDDGRRTTSQLTIAGDSRPTPTFTTLRPTVTTTATATRSPAGPARGGVGGSQDGLNTGEIAAGAALVVAAAGGVVYVLRRRGGSRQH